MGAATLNEPMDRSCQSKREAGFSILEALVAMAILAGALLPLLALQGQFVKTTEALERNEQRLAAQDLALRHISSLNLDQSPAGSVRGRYGQIEWRARPHAGPHRGRGAGGSPSRYIVTLYNVEVSISYNSGQSEDLVLQGVGWHPTASIWDSL